LLTPPTETAMRFNLDFLKKAGFNMLRKFIKVEPALYPQIFSDAEKIAVFCGDPDKFAWSEPKVSHHLLIFISSCHECSLKHTDNAGKLTEYNPLMKNHWYAIQAGTSCSMNWNKGSLLILYVPKNHESAGPLFDQSSSDLGNLFSLISKNFVIAQLITLIRHCCKGDVTPYKSLVLESAGIILPHIAKAAHARAGNCQRSDSLTQRQFDVIEKYMMEHLDGKVNIATLARLVSLSQSQFMRLFKNTTNIPAMDYYGRLRIQKAGEMLGSGTYYISHVVSRLGFCDHSMLVRHCRKYLHATPKQLMNKSVTSKGKIIPDGDS
jgi:AraC-like DNA-binding protein